MTKQHPLTDQICEELSVYQSNCDDETIMDMRAAADWQLKQVTEWLNETIFERSMCQDGVDNLPEELEKVMRPQQQQEDN